MYITNSEQLLVLINEITEVVIDEVAHLFYKELMDRIGSYVYRHNNQQYAYGSGFQTGEFAESWQVESNGLSATVEQDYSIIHSEPDRYVHGSNYYSEKDASEWIAYYINEGKSGSIFDSENVDPWWREERPFWDDVIELVDSGWLDRKIRQTYKQYGITVEKIGGDF